MAVMIESLRKPDISTLGMVHKWLGNLLCLNNGPDMSEIDSSGVSDRSQNLTLTGRIARHGKIRVLFICDENMGRSPWFALGMKMRVRAGGCEELVEVMSAGTDVIEKESAQKNDGRAHSEVERQMRPLDEDITGEHRVTQYVSNMITPNTILVALNDINKLPEEDLKGCFSVFDFGMDDPYDESDTRSIRPKLVGLSEVVFGFTWDLNDLLLRAIKDDSLEVFPKRKKMQKDSYVAYLG